MTDDRPSPRPRDDAAPDRGGPAGPAFSADDLAHLTGGRLLRGSRRPIRGGAVDSRLVGPGELFVALEGERTDGHRFLAVAAEAGAAALLVSRPPDEATMAAIGDVTVVLVTDGLRALQAVAAGWRARFRPLVVGVTGSIAKTSTKEAIATVLAADRRTLRSEGNQNNEIGLPLTLLRLGPDDEAAVLEMGMYVGGEIRDLAAIARPRFGVVTAVLGVHLSRIGSIGAIEDAKAELVEALPVDGCAILNADDPRVRRMADRTIAPVLSYGFTPDADVGAESVASAGLDGMAFTLRLPDRDAARPTGLSRRFEAHVPALGRLSVHNALAAAAVGWAAGMAPSAIVAALDRGWSAPHRGQVVRAGPVTVIDDAYNASPVSTIAALDLLAGLPGRRVAVLGQMLELGDGSADGHREVGRVAAAACEVLCVVGSGPDPDAMAEAAAEAGLTADRLIRAVDVDAAAELLGGRLVAGDVVLVKASRGVALERLVAALVARFGGNPDP